MIASPFPNKYGHCGILHERTSCAVACSPVPPSYPISSLYKSEDAREDWYGFKYDDIPRDFFVVFTGLHPSSRALGVQCTSSQAWGIHDHIRTNTGGQYPNLNLVPIRDQLRSYLKLTMERTQIFDFGAEHIAFLL
ncbi:hypothetical protein IG631_04294 [Alternaria alternata]|nr:hypothetical protein IG631_04294 [Alternaria alternata]